MKTIILVIALAVVTCGCYRMRASKGGGEVAPNPQREINAADISVPPGYKIELVAQGFTFAADVAFDDHGVMHVLEAGYSYGEVWLEPKLIRVEGNNKTTIATGKKNGPWTGVSFHDGNFYVSEGGAAAGGKILKITPRGEITTLVENLPSIGDHHTNVHVIKDGYIYFGQGTATNAAVVGEDNASFGWLKRQPEFHEIPCGDIVLTGENFETANVLTEEPDDKAITGAFVPFGEKTTPGQIVKGRVPCTGSIMRIPLEGGQPEMVAWGLRNPFGIAVSPDGKIFTTENSYDERGSRFVWGTGDVLWEVVPGTWYGYPDFSAGKSLANDEEFKSPSKKEVKPLMAKYPNDPPRPVAILGVHSSSNGFEFSRSSDFGYVGEAFIAQFGDMAPNVGKVLAPVGFKIVRVNTATGVVRDFAVNKGKRNGPATLLQSGGLERPVTVRFSKDGTSLYIVDFGIIRIGEKGPQPITNTGAIWKITKQ